MIEAMSKYSHKQVLVGEVHVDEGLADLLTEIWDRGMDTVWSCQGGLHLGDVSEQAGYTPSMFNRAWWLDDTPLSDPHIVFEHYVDAVYFLKNSVGMLPRLKIDIYGAPAWDMAAQALPPLGSDAGWRGNVVWAHHLTDLLTQAWKTS